MLKWRFVPVFLAALALSGCPSPPLTPGPKADCQGACEAAEKLDCSIAKPTKKGAECIDVCKSADEGGFPWNAACMQAATTCDVLESCE